MTSESNEIKILHSLGYKLAETQQELTPLQRAYILLVYEDENRQNSPTENAPKTLDSRNLPKSNNKKNNNHATTASLKRMVNSRRRKNA